MFHCNFASLVGNLNMYDIDSNNLHSRIDHQKNYYFVTFKLHFSDRSINFDLIRFFIQINLDYPTMKYVKNKLHYSWKSKRSILAKFKLVKKDTTIISS